MDIFQKVELRQKTKCAQTLVLYSSHCMYEISKGAVLYELFKLIKEF